MVTKSDLIDIACKVVRNESHEKSIAVVDGTEEIYNGKKQPKWFWVPRSQCEINDDGTVTMPEWIARDKGLI